MFLTLDRKIPKDELFEMGREARGQLTRWRLQLGALACAVAIHYGEDTLGEFAYEINVEASTVRDYRRVFRFWENALRNGFLDTYPMTNWSMLRAAVSTGSLDKAQDIVRSVLDADKPSARSVTDTIKNEGIVPEEAPSPLVAQFHGVVSSKLIMSDNRITFTPVGGKLPIIPPDTTFKIQIWKAES